MPSNKLHPFGPESLIRWKLMHQLSFLVCVLAALTVRSASNAISPSSTFWFPAVIHIGLLFCTQHYVTSLCHVVFWPRNLNATFCSKINQFSTLEKSSIFIVDTVNFGIVHFELEIFENRIKKFRFIGTLAELNILSRCLFADRHLLVNLDEPWHLFSMWNLSRLLRRFKLQTLKVAGDETF